MPSEKLNTDGTERQEDDPLTPSLDGRPLERMWAGGSFHFTPNNATKVGEQLIQKTTLGRHEAKEGRQGSLNIFVWLDNVISNDRGECVREKRCRLFRPEGAASKQSTLKPAANTPAHNPSFDFSEIITPDVILLFRFSALTFNPHKIHYDRRFCTEVEGRPGMSKRLENLTGF